MRKIILGSLAILTAPQAVVAAFFAFAITVAGDSPGIRIGWVVSAGIVLVASMVANIIALTGAYSSDPDVGWVPEFTAERRAMKVERERVRREIDRVVGIPRV